MLEDQRFYTSCTVRETRGIGFRGPDQYQALKTRIKKLPHFGLWRALYDRMTCFENLVR
jgi:hypothetical protein